MRILIVEDDAANARGLAAFLGSLNHKDTILIAANGREALDLITSEPAFDLAFVDVNMPVMNGLEFLKEARFRYPYIRIVILSAYSTFEYAQQALRLGALDYILKPFSPRDVSSLTTYVRSLTESTGEESDMILPEHSITLISRWLINPMQYGDAIRRLFPQICSGRVLVFSLLDSREATKFQFHAMISQVIRAASRLLYDIFSDRFKLAVVEHPQNNTRFVALLLPYKSGTPLDPNDEAALSEALKALDERLRFSLGVVISEETGSAITKISAAYRQADALTQSLFFAADYGVISPGMCARPGATVLPSERMRELERAVLDGSLDGVQRAAAAVFQKLVEPPYASLFDLFSTFRSFLANLVKTANEQIGSMGRRELEEEIEALFYEYTRIDEFKARTMRLCLDVAERIRTHQNDKNTAILERALFYLRENLADGSLSQESVAATFYFSPSYFSMIFKKQTGLTFTKYLNGMRIEAARELLRNPALRISDIAPSVGFQDAHYFIRVFKKATGMTPSEYRSRLCAPRADEENNHEDF